MANERLRSKPFLGVALGLASLILASNVITVAHGHLGRLLACAANVAVIVALLTRYKYARLIVRIWAALPVLSLGLFLLASLLRWRLGETALLHAATAATGVVLYIWAGRAFQPPEDFNNAFKPGPLRESA